MYSSTLRITVMACLVLVMLIGPMRIMEFLYRYGLYPAVSEQEVIAALKRSSGAETVTCRKDVADWEYVCDYVVVTPGLGPTRYRQGIITSWLTPIGFSRLLPVDGPVPTQNQLRSPASQEYQELVGPVNLRSATPRQLERIPLIDKELATRIHAAVRSGVVTSVDDLLKIRGIDSSTLAIIRRRLYWQ